MERVWVIRAGQQGQWEQFNLDHGLAGGRFHEVGDLSMCTTRNEIRRLVTEQFPGAPQGRIDNYVRQLATMRLEIKIGDLVVMPLHHTPCLALGRVVGTYHFRSDPDLARRHVLPVQWLATDLRRDALQKDFKDSLKTTLVVFQLTRNDLPQRVQHLLETGIDPDLRHAAAAKTAEPRVPEAKSLLEEKAPWVAERRSGDSRKPARMPPSWHGRTCRACGKTLPGHMFDSEKAKVCSRCRQASRARSAARSRGRFVSGGLPTLGKGHR